MRGLEADGSDGSESLAKERLAKLSQSDHFRAQRDLAARAKSNFLVRVDDDHQAAPVSLSTAGPFPSHRDVIIIGETLRFFFVEPSHFVASRVQGAAADTRRYAQGYQDRSHRRRHRFPSARQEILCGYHRCREISTHGYVPYVQEQQADSCTLREL